VTNLDREFITRSGITVEIMGATPSHIVQQPASLRESEIDRYAHTDERVGKVTGVLGNSDYMSSPAGIQRVKGCQQASRLSFIEYGVARTRDPCYAGWTNIVQRRDAASGRPPRIDCPHHSREDALITIEMWSSGTDQSPTAPGGASAENPSRVTPDIWRSGTQG